MRRTILLCVVVLLALALVAPTATAIPKEPKGCPAEASVWTEIGFVTDPSQAWRSTTFYAWYWAIPEAIAVWHQRGRTDEQIYFFFVPFFETIDRNGDSSICAWYIGGNPGTPDDFISVVDNNANAQH